MKTLELPTHAGPISLKQIGSRQPPQRLENEIRIPVRDEMIFTSLKGGEQFVVCYPIMGRKHFIGGFFGGMDESAFITPLKTNAVETLLEQGEDAFFDTLVPTEIKFLSEQLPDMPVNRQGDTWSIPLGITWDELFAKEAELHSIVLNIPSDFVKKFPRRKRRKMLNIYRKHSLPVQPQEGSSNVLRTNHVLEGRYVKPHLVRLHGQNFSNIAIGEGILTAPDHEDRELTGGPHVLARTRHLAPISAAQRMLGWE